MSNIIPFSESSLPAHLRAAAGESMADDLIVGGGGFPVMSIKGKVFTIKRSDSEQILMRPDDEETPASSIEIVLLRAQKAVTKTYYDSGYTDGSDAKPTCYSNDGVEPAADAQEKQCNKCAICPHNQWGSKITDSGKEAKACQDNKRIAIAAVSTIDDPMLLRIPPGSFKALTEYAKLLKTRGLDYNMVVTRVSFEAAAAVPQLKFKPMGFLDEAAYAKVKTEYNSDLVQDIIGLTNKVVPPETEAPVTETKAEEKPAPKTEAKAEEKPAPKKTPPKKAAPKKAEPVMELRLTEEAIAEGYTLEGFREGGDDAWSDEEIVAEGYAEWVEVAAEPAKAAPKKRTPAKKAAPKEEAPLVDVPVDAALEDALAELDSLDFDD